MRAARSFLSNLIDYAGLFPPASLGMDDAVRAYDAYKSGPYHDLLGRFVVAESRLDEFASSASSVLPRTGTEPWRVSLIATAGSFRVGDRALQFNGMQRESETGNAVCDSIEMPVASEADVNAALESIPDFFQLFLEIPIATDPYALVGALAGTRACAKMRTGGITSSAIPDSRDVVRFMRACRSSGVPFKATAGLHHAVRANYPLTYEPDPPRAEMFGYLNVFLAAAFLDAGADDTDVIALVEESDASAFQFDDGGVTWRGERLTVDQLHDTRRTFAISYGSCSFTEPVTEAHQLGLIQ